MDFLNKYDGSIKVDDRTLKTPKNKLKLNKQHSTGCAHIFVSHDEVIQAKPEQLIPAKIDKLDIGKENTETMNYQIQTKSGKPHQNSDIQPINPHIKCQNTSFPKLLSLQYSIRSG